MSKKESWGRYPAADHTVLPIRWDSDILPAINSNGKVLAYGQGRSYGDACLNDKETLLDTNSLNRLISFNSDTGIIHAEAGMTLKDLLAFSVPRGWFIPVSPGTQYVSLGGAVANDVHGKNHHVAGTFGRHVLSIHLIRSDREELTCSPKENTELFNATVAGLGLTGFMKSITLQLIPIKGPYIDMESIKFERLDEFFQIAKDSDKDFDYTVAWIDCVNAKPHIGRGIFMRGNHSQKERANKREESHKSARDSFLQVPFDFPKGSLNRLTLGMFNKLYYNKQQVKKKVTCTHYVPFFYPLDAVLHWNRIYGKRGFLQFQCVVPSDNDNKAIREILDRIVRYGKASFLAVIKNFGEIPSPGLLSFPRPGVTLCLDFPYEGEKTLKLFRELEEFVLEYDGALYPAKDACMQKKSFRTFYPKWETFQGFIDPKFTSSFWERVNR